jgi:DNA-binding transcriptional LysR family regulator
VPKDIDLNLLKPLQALLEERSVTRAAERLSISQPAASAALARLRRHFNDELLTRVGNTHRLTPLAAQLNERIAGTVSQAERIFTLQQDFGPATSHREFVVVLSDYTVTVLGEALSHLLDQQAPNVRLHLRQVTAETVDTAPESLRHIDAFILPHGFLHDLPYHDLLQDEWMCLVSTGNTVVGDRVTSEHLAELAWVLTYHRPTAYTTAVRELRTHGIEPRVAMVTESYSTLPALLAGTDRIALVQRGLADRLTATAPVRALPCPVPLAPLLLALWWHPTNTADAGHQWLRGLLIDAAERVPAGGASSASGG